MSDNVNLYKFQKKRTHYFKYRDGDLNKGCTYTV